MIMTETDRIEAIKAYLKRTRKELNKCTRNDSEYNTACGNGINSSEASEMFREVEYEIKEILKQ
jgi:hypothetical protein